ncbi:mucoidy inhibitor MuiA family protein [Algoriphagus lacus]|uniref:Mucoidy inhibitor MuiA family protein n=1 Tax=Algoriphagus lacus TaxID=2056311 RepID=A0A418PVH8_9BACT|nr:mucoidy inhibitor MuiA family protein [Algoriphagus lacus]RIW18170.1 mucoidy inhibitor MuiA family protein [Algoriphagus lacus]
MKKSLFILLSLILIKPSFSQELKETSITSKIHEVTLFLSGAQVFETASGQISSGESVILIKGLSPYLDEKSIQVKGQGNFTIQSVNKRLDFLSEKEVGEKIKALEAQIEEIEKSQTLSQNRLQVLTNKAGLLAANKDLGGNQTGPTMTELRTALDFFDAELTKITNEELQVKSKIQAGERELEKLRNQINAMQESENKSTSEIRIRVKASAAGAASFQINYLVANAGWYPKYDIRVKNITQPLQLNYKAEVYQNTGVDWKNVKLRFSNANPNQSGQAPNLEKWELNYARFTTVNRFSVPQTPGQVSGVVLDEQGEPIPGATVLVKGTTIGTSTDLEGRYSIVLPQNAKSLVFSFIGYRAEERTLNGQSSLNVSLLNDTSSLSEVVVTGYGTVSKKEMASMKVRGASNPMAAPLETSFVENQTTVEIEVAEPYSIKTNGEKTLVELKAYEIPATYRYTAIPKLDKDAFLIAELTDWNQYSLLEGESNLYFEEGFVGRSILNAADLQDTLQVSMGRDRSIVMQREKVDQYSKKRTIGANITENRGYEITLKNNKSQAVTLVLKDQIPVSVNSSITVTAGELSGGNLDTQTGIVTWEITLPPGAQQKLALQYEVKYPKSERIILD